MLGQFAVVGQDHQSFGLVVQPPHRHQSATHSRRQKIQHRRPPLGIRARRDTSRRFVQQHIAILVNLIADPLTVYFDRVALQVDPLAEDRQLAVDRDSTLANQSLDLPTRGHTDASQYLL